MYSNSLCKTQPIRGVHVPTANHTIIIYIKNFASSSAKYMLLKIATFITCIILFHTYLKFVSFEILFKNV